MIAQSRLWLTVRSQVAPCLARIGPVRRTIGRTVSQMLFAYLQSALSEGRAGRISNSDRLPWVESARTQAPLDGLSW